MILRRLVCICLLFVFAFNARAEDGEDFDEVEDGVMFDIQRYGLMFLRNLYFNGDDVTSTIPYPTYYNDTRYIGRWKPYISHWEYEPPNFVVLYLNNDMPLPASETKIDLRVTVGSLDRAGNLVPANVAVRERIPVNSGINRIPINIQVYKGDIVRVQLMDIVQKLQILELEVTD